ncbi:MAG: helix-turn-helix domain-containing protein [Solirubrobacteraceae bacterium]
MPGPTNALYVRLPQPEFDRLDRAAEALNTNKKTLVTNLVASFVDPDSEGGLAQLRDVLLAAPGVSRAGAGDPRRVTITLPDEGMAVGHHAFTPAPAPDVLTPAQAADLLQVPEAELLALAEAGELPGRRIGEHWRFSRPALIAWLAQP